jgi:hypothetical protein
MYSPKLTELIDLAKANFPTLDLINLFTEYSHTQNQGTFIAFYPPGAQSPGIFANPNLHTHKKTLYDNSVDNRLLLQLESGKVFLSLFHNWVDKRISPCLEISNDGIFLYADLSFQVCEIYSENDDEYGYLDDAYIRPDLDYVTFDNFLSKKGLNLIKVELPERFVCLPVLKWDSKNLKYISVQSYYCLESEANKVSQLMPCIFHKV